MNYRYEPIREAVKGHSAIGLDQDEIIYHSKLEARMAKLLLANGIPFYPHRTFRCINREGESFSYEIDFVLRNPHKFAGISHYIQAIEVKGVLTPHDFTRIDAIKYCYHIRGYIVLEPLIEFWENHGLFWKTNNFYGHPRRSDEVREMPSAKTES